MFTTLTEKGSLDLLVFEVNAHRYALPATSVTEVVRAVAITALPGAPRVVEGVINFKGTLVPVIDIRMRFGLPAQVLAASDLMVIANSGTRLIALRCDGGASVRRGQSSEIETDPDALSTSRFVAGLAKFADGTVVIHDLAAFLSEAESAALERALSAESSSADA